MTNKNTSEEDRKINLDETTKEFQSSRRESEVESKRIIKDVAVGKSTLASILLHPEKGFEAGVNTTGLTKTFKEKKHPSLPYTVIDTPGLVSEKNRENLGLQKDGRYKIIFIATATQLGHRPEDSSTALSLIAKRVQEISLEKKFAIIINKATESIQQRWGNDQEGLMECKVDTIPYIPEIDNVSDPVSKISKKYLPLIKKTLESIIKECPTISLSRTREEPSELNDSKEKEADNRIKSGFSFLNVLGFGPKGSSKKTVEAPNLQEIEPPFRKEVKLNPQAESNIAKEKIKKRNQPSDFPDQEKSKNTKKNGQKQAQMMKEQYENYREMPQCFEKQLISLLYYVILRSHNLVYEEIKIKREFSVLKQSAKYEEIESEDIGRLLTEIDRGLSQQDWKTVSIDLEAILRKIRSLDIKYMMDLFQKAEEAAKSIKDKEVFLLLGNTGVGKSTLIHFLAGSQMGIQEVGDFSHIGPISVANNLDLKRVIVAPYTVSETRYITPVKIDHRNESVIFCDSPGFEDTNGPEVDIAGCFGIIKAIQDCKAVRPIVLLSNKSGDRFEVLRRNAHIIVRMIPDIKNHLDKFSYIFTKFSQEGLKNIPAALEDIIENLKPEEKSDTTFKEFIFDMNIKIKKQPRISIDVLNDDPEEIITEFMRVRSIKNPGEVFKVSLSSESAGFVREQCRKHQLAIMSAAKRGDFALAKFKLDELKELNGVLDRDYIQNIYQECVRSLLKTVNQNYDDAVFLFNQRLRSKITFNSDDISKYQEYMKKAENAEALRYSHLGSKAVSLAAYESKIFDEIKAQCAEFTPLTLGDTHAIQEIADKIQLLSNLSSSGLHNYNDLLQKLREMVSLSFENFQKATQEDNFEESGRELSHLHLVQQNLSNHLSAHLLKKFETAQNILLEKIKKASSMFDSILEQEFINENDFTDMASSVNMLASCKKAHTLQPHISLEFIKENYDTLVGKLERMALNHISKIDQQLNGSQRTDNFDIFESKISQIVLLREKIPVIQFRTSESFHNLINIIVNSVKNIKLDIERVLVRSIEKGETNYEELNTNLVRLSSAKWIETYSKDLFQNIFMDVKGQLCLYLDTLKVNIQEANLDQLENHNLVLPISKKVTDASKMKSLNEIIPEIEQTAQKFVTEFSEAVEKALTLIIDDFQSTENRDIQNDHLDFFTIEKAHNYITATKSVDSRILSPTLRDKAEAGLKNYMGDYSKRLLITSDQIFQNLQNYDPAKYDRSEISNLINILVSNLRDVSELFEDKRTIYDQYFPKLVEKCRKLVRDYQKDLKNKLTDSLLYKLFDATVWLSIAKGLEKLDGFMKEIESFGEIYNTYSKSYFEQTNKALANLLSDINSYRYQDANAEMERLKQTDDMASQFNYSKAKTEFNTSLVELTDSLTGHMVTISPQLKVEDIRYLEKHLKIVERARNFMSQHLKDPNTLEEFIKESQAILSRNLSAYFNELEVLLKGNRFLEAEEKYTATQCLKLLPASYLNTSVVSGCDLFEKQRETHVERIQKKFSDMPLEDYIRNPPIVILRTLEEATGKHPLYATARDELASAIKAKIDNRLNELRNANEIVSRETFIKFELILAQLPQELKPQHELDLLRTDFEEQQNAYNTQFQEAKRNGNLNALKNLYNETKNSGSRTIAMEIKDFITREVQKHLNILKISLQESRIEESFQTWKLISLGHYSMFQGDFDEVCDTYVSAKELFTKSLDALFAFMIAPFIKLDLCTISEETMKTLHLRLDGILRLRNLRKQNPELFPDGFESAFIEMCRTIAKSFTLIGEKFETGLKDLDVPQLQSGLIAIAKWYGFSEKIKSSVILETQLMDGDELVNSLPDANYYTGMIQRVSEKLHSLKNEITQIMSPSLVTDSFNFVKSEVDDKYKHLRETLLLIKRFVQFKPMDTVSFNPDELIKTCNESVEHKIQDLNLKSQNLLRENLTDISSGKKSREFLVCFRHLESISENLGDIFRTSLVIDQLRKEILDKVRQLEHECKISFSEPLRVGKFLKLLKMVSQNTEILKEDIDSRIDTLLKEYKDSVSNDRGLGRLGVILNDDKDGVGAIIISEHKLLEGFSNSIFIDKTNRHGIKYVLDNLEGDSLNKELLNKRYNKYEECFKKLRNDHLKPNFSIAPIVSEIKSLVGNVTQEHGNIQWNLSSELPELIAHISILYTLQHAQNYFEANNQENYLVRLHAAQIISVFRMLGVGDDNEKLLNNIVQVGTGEGKSLIIAITASVLALCGFGVRCVCYSEYLCQRDFEAFTHLFQSLEIMEYIHYGTFNKCCEDMINRDGDIRKITNDLISFGGFTLNKKKETKQRAEIIIIDEVDVFFQKEFYGNIYTPSVSLDDPTIQILTDYIWENKGSTLRFAQVKASAEYKNCYARFNKWGSLIGEAVKEMLADLKTFESHDYIAKDDKIAYKDHSNLVFNLVYGYKTLWAYYKEHDDHKISQKSLQENIRIRVQCGSFSYAHIPEQFSFAMGVTGTLKTLSEPENNIVSNVYNIKKKTFMPSVFGKNNLDPDHYYKISNKNDYFNTIATEVKKALKNNRRAVLVFFESEKIMMEFYKSNSCSTLPSTPQFLTEEATSKEKDSFVRRATVAGRINLLTKTFGRGTDFVCYDQTIIDNGGIAVIQTFLSEELSEETQIKGRTARQGAEGSYGMVLLDTDLEKFLIMPEDIKNFYDSSGLLKKFVRFILQKEKETYSIYDVLNERRNIYFQTQFESNREDVEFAGRSHKLAMTFRENLFAQNLQEIEKFLNHQNRGAEEVIKSRILVLMDATRSMAALLQKAKTAVSTMYERTFEMLTSKGLPQDCFELEFAAYRNYNNDENTILVHSPWESKPESLRLFLDKIKPSGGLGNEAIEIGLWHANQEAKGGLLKGIILIGDQRANTKEEVIVKRKLYHQEAYWRNSKFGAPTHYTKELAELVPYNIPVHSFYVNYSAKENFEEIARTTQGKCHFLDIHSAKGADMLTHLVCEEILQKAGDSFGIGIGNQLVQDYRNKYKSYV